MIILKESSLGLFAQKKLHCFSLSISIIDIDLFLALELYIFKRRAVSNGYSVPIKVFLEISIVIVLNDLHLKLDQFHFSQRKVVGESEK